MKTTILITGKVLLMMLIASSLLMSCTFNSTNNLDAENVTKVVKAPGIDLNTAAYMGNLAAVQQHIKAGTNLNTKEPLGGSTPLLTACVFGKTEIAKALINAGADLDMVNNDGSTPLHVAAFFCHTEIVQSLIANGANINALNGQGATALQSVAGPFSEVKPVYDFLLQQLGSLGLKLDYEQIEATRPVIAQMLQNSSVE
ncbi:ankyrin repeat domain-containing protein [Plebeiibacterium sediminum]|uniref:Ankyrin repeat domain-containing protein n=1 Tax=Plebeiibacterium sediminum TaxID=2992112 RepID=A0AAE3M187_9BACT|nr:ankyrin repeat domain-containing protein [Plebeiobacterium sediminum]MCW3785426.1 ankyrin repeat domain-containing protein [Plebeiobacterium sediminum]